MGLFLLLKYCFSSDFKWFSHIQLLVILYRCSTVLNQNISLNPVVFIFFRLFLFINNALAWQFQISLRSSSITVWVLNFMHWKSGLDAAATCKCNKCFLTMFLKLKYISYSCIPPICFPNSILCVMKEVNVFPPPPPTWSWTGLAHARSCIPPSALRYCRLNIFPGFVYKLTGTVNKLYSSAARGLIRYGEGRRSRRPTCWLLVFESHYLSDVSQMPKAVFVHAACVRSHVWNVWSGHCGVATTHCRCAEESRARFSLAHSVQITWCLRFTVFNAKKNNKYYFKFNYFISAVRSMGWWWVVLLCRVDIHYRNIRYWN